MEYENPWVFDGTDVYNIPPGKYGYVYLITNLISGKKYIGRKYFWKKRTPKGKKRRVTSESDWKKYYGSCKELKQDIELIGKEFFHREILFLCDTQGQTNYKEVETQFIHNVLHERDIYGNKTYYNGNILSRYFAPKDVFDEKHRKRISESQISRYKKTPKNQEEKEHQRKKMREWWRLAPDEVKQRIADKLSNSMTGNILSDETRQKISKTLTGRKLSPETIAKMRGREPWNKRIGCDKWKERLGDNYKPPPTRAGKKLITDGETTKVITPTDPIPDGFHEGTCNKTTAKGIKVFYIDGHIERYDSQRELIDKKNIPLNTVLRLMNKWDDPKFLKLRKTFLDIQRIEYE